MKFNVGDTVLQQGMTGEFIIAARKPDAVNRYELVAIGNGGGRFGNIPEYALTGKGEAPAKFGTVGWLINRLSGETPATELVFSTGTRSDLHVASVYATPDGKLWIDLEPKAG